MAQFALLWANIPRKQCDIANQHFGCDGGVADPACCDEGACDEMESLRLVLERQGCLVTHSFVSDTATPGQLQVLRGKVLERLNSPEPVAFRVQSSGYKHFIVCNGLMDEMVLLEDPCGPQYTYEPEAEFLGRMLYNGQLDITRIFFLRKTDGSFKCS